MTQPAIPLQPAELAQLRSSLLGWYDQHRRELPWRTDADAYRVWVSEIMLQQTRVAAVLEHFASFMRRFPTVEALASAREQSVLAVWSGLGYYHRARRMHQAAKVIARERGGKFPHTAEDWRQLPGIGRYTAAAIASIAFGETIAVVDGNVERVLTRMFGPGVTKEVAWHRAEALLSRDRPGDFNQAMMEVGATLCTPRAPQCLLCPLITWCATRGVTITQPAAPRRCKQVHYGLARRKTAVLLVQRPAEVSLMAAMWELPQFAQQNGKGSPVLGKFRHSITDTDYEVSVFAIPQKQLLEVERRGHWFTSKQWQGLALTGLARKILRKLVD